MSDNPETLQQAVIYFADLDRCDDFMRRIRWEDRKPRCIHCESDNLTWMASRRKYQCNACRKCRKRKAALNDADRRVRRAAARVLAWLRGGA